MGREGRSKDYNNDEIKIEGHRERQRERERERERER